MKNNIKKIGGLLMMIIGLILSITVLFSPAGIFSSISELKKCIDANGGTYEVSYAIGGIFANLLFIFLIWILFKKGKKLVFDKQKKSDNKMKF